MKSSTSPHQSAEPPDRPGSSDRHPPPKLGDFSKLLHAAQSGSPHEETGHQVSADISQLVQQALTRYTNRRDNESLSPGPGTELSPKTTNLGDLSKIFSKFSIRHTDTPARSTTEHIEHISSTQETVRQAALQTSSKPVQILRRDDHTQLLESAALTTVQNAPSVSSSSQSGSGSGFDSDVRDATEPSTPEPDFLISANKAAKTLHNVSQSDLITSPSPFFWQHGNKAPPQDQPAAQSTTTKRSAKKDSKAAKVHCSKQILFTYQYPQWTGPEYCVLDYMRSKEQKRSDLLKKLTAENAVDNFSTAENGVHIFVDMSNIIISFKRTVMAKYGVPDYSSLKPLPELNVDNLHEVLVRGRDAWDLFAGCSTLPGMNGAPFVHELHELGYHVDLRNRQQEPVPIAAQKNSKNANYNSPVRYVESMVDETIQARIAETVMEYHDKQGTLVIATGDAKPANFSDGFFAYAERALKMGWHVEVVSWSVALSQSWQNSAFRAQWGDRFRIVSLDPFLDELYARYSH